MQQEKSTIETKKLLLRPITLADAEDMFFGWAKDTACPFTVAGEF